MKRKNLLKIIVAVGLVLALSAVLFACNDKNAGLSAYDIAVKNGFVGTEEEWLAGLKGTDGKDGNLAMDDIYAAAVANGFQGSYLEFLKEYLNTDLSNDSTYAVSNAIRSAVIVISNFTRNATNFWGYPIQGQETSYQAGGAGVIYKMDGEGNAYVVTNFHVVYDAASKQPNHVSDNIELYLYGGTTASSKIPATFVGGSAYYDIAVLEVSGSEVLKKSDAVAVTVASE